MRVASSEPFHVNCQHTKRSICYCIEGTPLELRDSNASKQYSENARILNEFWQQPAEVLFNSTDAVDVIVPRLLRRERVQASPPEAPKNQDLAIQLDEAKKKSARCAMMAASLAARGGLLYSPPLGVEIQEFVQQLEMHDQTKLEERVAQVLRIRSEFAAAAAAAEVAERGVSYPYNFINGGSGGGGGAAMVTTVPTTAARIDGISQQQHLPTMIMVANPSPSPQQQPQQQPQPLIKFPQAHRRGPRKRAPPKTWRLLPEDNSANLIGKLIQILGDSPKEWRPAIVAAVDAFDGSATIVFESDEQQMIPLRSFIENNEVAWLKKIDADEYNSLRSTSQNNSSLAAGGGGGDGSSGKKRGAPGKMSMSLPSKYQMVSPPSSSIGGGDSIGINGGGYLGSGAGFSGIALTAPTPTPTPTVPAAAAGVFTNKKSAAAAAAGGIEEEEDREKVVLQRLKSVTKRQRAAAAKKVATNNNSSKASPDGHNNNNNAYDSIHGAGNGNGVEVFPSNPVIRQGTIRQEISNHQNQQRQQQRQHQQGSLPLPTGFMPLPEDRNLSGSRQNSTAIGNDNVSSYGAVAQRQKQQLQEQQQQTRHQQQQQEEHQQLMRSASLVMPSLFQLGDAIMKGKGIQLTISNITLPATVHKIEPEKQSVLLVVKGRAVVLKAEDEGIKYKLAFI